jgi:uroporphyrinogen decarboxylase
MNSRQRVLAAIDHKIPDRVPITFDAEKEVVDSLKKHFEVSTRDEVWDSLNVDTRLIGVDHHNHHIRIEGKIHYNFWGIGQIEQAYSGGTYMEYCYHPLQKMETVDEIERYDWPAPDAFTVNTLKATREKYPDKAIIAHITHGGYFTSTFMRGMETFLEDLGARPEMAEAILGKITGYLFSAIERLCQIGGNYFDIYYIADDFCTALGPIISPSMFRQYVKPYLTEIARIVHAHDKKLLLHVCGSVRRFLPDILEAGVDLLEPIQTSAVGMDVEGLKKDFGDKLTFYGSIDLINVLSKCTPDEVRREVKKNFNVLGKNGGFVLGPGHTYIQPDVPLENILAMYVTAYRDCRY